MRLRPTKHNPVSQTYCNARPNTIREKVIDRTAAGYHYCQIRAEGLGTKTLNSGSIETGSVLEKELRAPCKTTSFTVSRCIRVDVLGFG